MVAKTPCTAAAEIGHLNEAYMLADNVSAHIPAGLYQLANTWPLATGCVS